MSEETMDLTPQLTLTPDSAAAQPQAPSLTLEPNADQQQAQGQAGGQIGRAHV